MADGEVMTKAQRLELAAAEAPLLRNASEKTLARRVALVDKDGKVTGYTSGREVLRGLAKAADLEHAVEGRAKKSFCTNCGKLITLPPRYHGGTPTICKVIGGCFRQAQCAGEGCDARPPARAFSATCLRSRAGKPWKCSTCARIAAVAAIPPEVRSERARRAASRLTKEQASARAKKGHGRNRKKSKETAEQRHERCLKSWITRRANIAKREGVRGRQESCAHERCQRVPPKSAMEPNKVRRRHGRPWLCTEHSRRAAEREAAAKQSALSNLTDAVNVATVKRPKP